MFKDLALSREAMRDYHSKLPEDDPGQLLTAMVLQRSAWPFTAQKHTVDLPPNVNFPLYSTLPVIFWLIQWYCRCS
jgi:cullin-4